MNVNDVECANWGIPVHPKFRFLETMAVPLESGVPRFQTPNGCDHMDQHCHFVHLLVDPSPKPRSGPCCGLSCSNSMSSHRDDLYIYISIYLYIYTYVRQRLKKITLFFHQTWRKHGLLPANFLEANPMDHGSHAAWDLFWYPLLSILRLAGARFAPFSWSGPYFLSLCAVYGWQLLRVLHCGTACRRTKNFGRLAVVEDHGANMCKHQILGEHAGYHVSSAAEGSPRFTSANVKDKSFLPCPVAVGPIFAMRLVG